MHWHQLFHVQTICTSFQTDNHNNTSSLNFYRPGALPDAQPTVSKHWRHIELYMEQRRKPAVWLGKNARISDDCILSYRSNYLEVNSKTVSNEASLCWASSLGCQCTCCWAPAPAAATRRRCPQLSIDISCVPNVQQQTCLLSIDGKDRRTDRRSDARPLHRHCSAYHAGSVNKASYCRSKCNENKRQVLLTLKYSILLSLLLFFF